LAKVEDKQTLFVLTPPLRRESGQVI